MVLAKSTAGLTAVSAVAVLFAVFVSNAFSFDVTVAELVIVSGASLSTVTVTVTVELAPAANVPRATLKSWLPAAGPDTVPPVALTNVTLAGSVSLMTTPVAWLKPLFVTTSV